MIRCKWEKDVHGFYVTPLVGISKIRGTWSIWVGWFYWLWTWYYTPDEKNKSKRATEAAP